ncbi:pyridoxal phosphate phosphatase PHOSPHO2 [Calliopsis andreniformis]|uniref:pyridoxal phosphate phosphatase PHOSPHO2 n=1 Tax=Calliopsis andreniformis TaxID=337506 RepID=UPI003FCCA5BB
MHRSVLAAFDFDHTITDGNTDVVARELLPKEKLTDNVKELCRSSGWIAYMGKIFELLHGCSIDVRQIKSAIANMPPVLGIMKLLKELHANGCEIIIISDSNTIFINEWLKSKKLDHVITEVFTNPATINGKGMIELDMYHIQDSCKLSTINLCKGQILENYIQKRKDAGVRFDRVVYVGDGRNDLCPILRLSQRDLAFPRKDYVLIKILNGGENNGEVPKVKARVFPWADGIEILRKLQEEIGLPQCSP